MKRQLTGWLYKLGLFIEVHEMFFFCDPAINFRACMPRSCAISGRVYPFPAGRLGLRKNRHKNYNDNIISAFVPCQTFWVWNLKGEILISPFLCKMLAGHGLESCRPDLRKNIISCFRSPSGFTYAWPRFASLIDKMEKMHFLSDIISILTNLPSCLIYTNRGGIPGQKNA